jgi:hypothetical protein
VCADPAVPADDHAASDHRARPDPAARADLRSGFNHTQWADFGGRIDHRTLSYNCGRVNSGRTRWHRMEQRCDSGPANVWLGCENGHRCSRYPRLHVGMHDHSTGQRPLEYRCIASVVQKTHLIRAGRLQGCQTFNEQIEFANDPACRLRNNCERMWTASTKEACIGNRGFVHFPLPCWGQPQLAQCIPYPAQQFMAKRAGATVVEVPGSHAIYVSNPKAVAALIEQAASSVK